MCLLDGWSGLVTEYYVPISPRLLVSPPRWSLPGMLPLCCCGGRYPWGGWCCGGCWLGGGYCWDASWEGGGAGPLDRWWCCWLPLVPWLYPVVCCFPFPLCGGRGGPCCCCCCCCSGCCCGACGGGALLNWWAWCWSSKSLPPLL